MNQANHTRGIPGIKASLWALVLLLGLFILPSSSRAQNGTSISNAISAGSFGCGGAPFLSSRNNNTYGGVTYANNYNTTSYPGSSAQASKDVWYQVIISKTTDLTLSLCGSSFDTYLHLLNSSGGRITSNDDSNCGLPSYIFQPSLTAGTYYVVVEGYQSSTGNFSLSISSSGSPSPGATTSNAINVGNLNSLLSYTDNRSNADVCLGNEYTQNSSNDIVYQFSLSSQTTVTFSHCGSGFDTFMWLLNSSGNVIASNDDNWSGSSPCPGTQAYMQVADLSPGTYYLVSEGYGGYTGNILTSISVPGGGSNCTSLASSLSQDQNYIVTYSPRKPLTDANQLGNQSVCDVNQTVQYFDGLGRPLQTVQTKASRSYKDIIQPVEYDVYGREVKKYLPYTEGASYGSYRSNAISSQASFYNNGTSNGIVQINQVNGLTPSFAETRFEPSPLNRVEEQGAAGPSWQLTNGHTVKTEYGTNTANEVYLWTLTSNGATASYYQPNELYKTVIKDENWTPNQTFPKAGITEEFKDKDDHTVLKRTYNHNTFTNTLETLSTYYIYDDFGNLKYVIPPGFASTSFTEGDTAFNEYIYGYHYDGRNREVAKKKPAKGWEYLIYNKLDQVVMTQDANLRNHADQEWEVTKYDGLSRVVYTGIYVHAGSSAGTSYRDQLQAIVDGQGAQWETRNGDPSTGYTANTWPTSIHTYLIINYYDDYNFPGGNPYPFANSSNTKGLLTAVRTKILNGTTATTNMLWSVSYYDEDGRLIRSQAANHLGGSDITSNTYSFTDELLSSSRTHTANNNTTVINTRFEYDHVGRKMKTFQQIGNTPEITLSSSDYNELGQLKTKELHSANNSSYIHTTQYTYNERGWKRNMTGSKFSLTLAYDSDIQTGATPAYNGNIAEARYTTDYTGSNQIRYEYDKANRLIRSLHSQGGLSEDQIRYDAMGNIQYLERAAYGNLNYGYNGNRLAWVSGYLNKSYSYDPNGNMTNDGTKEYSYNMLDLPKLVRQGGSTILSYTYDAEGNKLSSTGSTGTWDYVEGIHYQNSQLKFINTEEGRAVYNPSTGNFKYEYALEDHLGNSRVFIDESNGQPRVIQEDEYYSFGLRKGRYDFASNNRYLYNGKELQDEIGMYDYGARFYDPAIGRWHSVDPRVEEDDEWSPYNYVRNNPILYNDPDGEIWNVVIGAAVGAAVDYGTQVAGNLVAGKTISQSLTQVDGRTILASAVLGGITSGASALGAGGAKATVTIGMRALPKVTTAQKVIAKTATTAKRVIENAKEKTHQTYTKPPKNPDTHGTYSGRTSGKNTPQKNVAKRDKDHHMNETHGPAELDKSSASGNAIRGREQQLVKKNGGAQSTGGTSGNAINAVGPKNKKAGKYEAAAKKEFGD